MPQNPNPFIRGYRRLRIERTLILDTEVDDYLVYVRLHESQRHLPDEKILFEDCVFNGYFALVTGDQPLSKRFMRQCPDRGHIRDVVFAILAEEDGSDRLVGYSPTRHHAASVVQRLTFETGFYSRCWEISSTHITGDAADFLAELADIATPTGFMFVAFRIPYSPAIGLKLIATPWTDENLLHVEGIDAGQLRQEHLDKGMPESLVDVVHLAALADVRILIFDGDAPVLDGLPVYEDDA